MGRQTSAGWGKQAIFELNASTCRVSEQCFTSPPTQYRLYGRRKTVGDTSKVTIND